MILFPDRRNPGPGALKALVTAAAVACLATVASAEGDPKAGKRVFNKCKACHTLKEDKNKTGPTLYNIIGAPAGAVEGFKYSEALKSSDLIWDIETLSAFLADPKEVVPGNKMSFPGLKKPKDIENLIAYILDKLN